MTKIYDPLPTVSLNAGSEYFHSGELPVIVHLDDSALDVMLDYKHVKAITINADAPISEARAEMQFCGVHLLLVTDKDARVVGLISSEDILGEKPVVITESRHIARADITVKMVMTPQSDIIAIPMEELRITRVGHVLQTLKNAKQHYALVVEINPDTQAQTVRGLFSLSQISKQLSINISDEELHATSLADLQKKIED
ncbi:MAG: hypothetical protein CMF50_00600 [Legionellales bacterium]|nr:hypothetical protein [Legionellales bacterium]|tara:strand:+ start:26088 stop:26684 length:597 start_codon:yes stop_codon:yes gene_type:complete